MDAAADPVVGAYRHADRPHRGDEVVEDPARDVLLHHADGPVREQVVLVGPQFEDLLVRHVGNDDLAEIGQSRPGADRGELVRIDIHVEGIAL